MKYYLSKGILKNKSETAFITVNRCGKNYELKEAETAAWLAATRQPIENVDSAADKLIDLGLAASIDCSDYVLGAYRLLTGCVIIPIKKARLSFGKLERRLWKWLTKAGLRLTMAELCYLTENCISPSKNYLGAANRQRLVEVIYTADTIEEGILESQMESARFMPNVLSVMLKMLNKGTIALI